MKVESVYQNKCYFAFLIKYILTTGYFSTVNLEYGTSQDALIDTHGTIYISYMNTTTSLSL